MTGPEKHQSCMMVMCTPVGVCEVLSALLKACKHGAAALYQALVHPVLASCLGRKE